jgi:hypothetical protein
MAQYMTFFEQMVKKSKRNENRQFCVIFMQDKEKAFFLHGG